MTSAACEVTRIVYHVSGLPVAADPTSKLRSEPGDSAAPGRVHLQEFERLVTDFGGRMLAVALRYLPNEADAQEAVQEAFLSAFKALPRFQGGSELSTWLHRITVNACLMKLRSKRRRPESSIENLLPTFLEDGHQTKASKDWSLDALSGIQQAETRTSVRRAIELLPDSFRLVLLLRDIEEFSSEQTGEMLGISSEAVRTRLHRARQALRSILEAEFGDQS